MQLFMTINTILEFAAIIFVFYFILGNNFSITPLKILLSAALFITQLVLQAVSINLFKFPIMNSFSVFIILLIIFEGSLLYKLCWLSICALSEGILSYIFSNIFYLFYNYLYNSVSLKTLLRYSDRILFIIFIIFSLCTYKSRESRKYIIKRIKKHNYCFIIFSCFISYLLLGLSEVLFYKNLDQTPKYIIVFLTFILITILLITILAFLTVQYHNATLTQKNEINQKYIEMEQAYYTQFKQKNNDLRAFRHDFNSHVFILQNLAQNEQWEQIKTYLQKLCEIYINNYYISTGNLIADAIINNFYNSLDKNILFKTSGCFSSECFVENFDICTILSNLINNASEALSGKNVHGTKEIYIDIESSVNRISILMKNTSANYEEAKTDNIQTTKNDKKNHGFGLANIRKTARKYNGFIKTAYKNYMFYTYVVLNKPIKTDT